MSKNKIFPVGFFDLLFDDEPTLSAIEQGPRRKLSIEEVKHDVARDLENLLNSRLGKYNETIEKSQHVKSSPLNYGIQDFIGLSATEPGSDTREEVLAQIKKSIILHEKRLKNIHLKRDENNQHHSSLGFSISATLIVNPTEAAINFDAMFLTTTQQYQIKSQHKS